MSIRLPFLQGASMNPIIADAVTNVLAKTAPQVLLTPMTLKSMTAVRSTLKDLKGTLLASALTSEEIASTGLFHSSATHTSSATVPGLCAEYNGVKLSVVRAIIPDPEAVTLRYRDRIDALAGFTLTKEINHIESYLNKAVQSAIQEAKERNITGLTVVLKPVSRYEKLNAIFVEVATKACAEAGIALNTVHTSQLHNKIIMFPEQINLILANDVPASDLLENVVCGMVGGTGIMYHALHGSGVHAFMGAVSAENPIGTLNAACEALKHLGYKQESEATLSALKTAITKTAQNRTVDLGGSLSPIEFARACCS